MFDIILGFTPAVCFAFIIGIEIPQTWRVALFVDGLNLGFKKWRPPLFIMTLLYGFFVRTTLEGVMGSYGIFLTDVMLYPMLYIIAVRTRWQTNRERRRTTTNGRREFNTKCVPAKT